ncbi:XrtA/PEP-CTERM system TPR-repeat protein PrsT [Bowmanella sp. JS7-9]|uniref:XrtA/PEP-CTERM system TPR-repeat protein PrsT n=1 Tax=Pseudobowmanella zhangzhouensis TaxID=1537679 RepID=A0ABW1XJ59_9ALTE|nr:XrtA/PEP-CTERM system TPR-repeat protein PrsT [Bowmanella sp. JS7-9]TBX21019.1 hypothetical protein TK45_13190 [Bowmanella sp. JS7-9]
MSVFRLRALCALLIIPFCTLAQSVNQYYEQALSAYDGQKPDTAFIHLKNALRDDPKHLPSRLLLGKIYFEHGIFSESEHELTIALQAGADINLVLPTLGNSLLLQKKSSELLKYDQYYNQLDRFGQFEWHMLAGQAYLQQDKPESAEHEFQKALAKAANDTRALNTLASHYIDQAQHLKATSLLEKSIQLDPQNKKTLLIQAKVQRLNNNRDEEFRLLKAAEALDGNDPIILRELVANLLNRGNIEQAIDLNETILSQSPNDPTAILIKAQWLKGQGKDKEANTLLEALANNLSLFDGSGGNVELVTGMTADMLKNEEAAVKSFRAHLVNHPDDVETITLLTQQYLRGGNFNKAIDVLQQHSRAVYRDLPLGIQLVNLLLQEKNPFKASQVVSELKQHFPADPRLTLLQGRIFASTNQPEIAIATLLQTPPDKRNLRFNILLAKLYLKIGKLAESEKIVNDIPAPENDSDKVLWLNLLASQATAQKQFSNAKKFASDALIIANGNLESRYLFANAAMLAGEMQIAEQQFKAMLADYPNHIPSALALAKLMLNKGDVDQAQSYLTKLLSYSPDDTAGRELQLALYMHTNQWLLAEKLVAELRKTDGLEPRYLLNQAVVFQALQQQEKAATNYQVLFEQWLNDKDGLNTLLAAQINAQAWSSAISTLKRLLILQPNDTRLQVTLARANFATGDLKQANAILSTLEKSSEVAPQVDLLKADIALQAKDIDTATALYRRALKLDPTLHIALVQLYQLAKDHKQEQSFFESANHLLNTSSQPVWVRKLLADAYMNANDLGMAEFHYKKLLGTEAFKQSPVILNNLANIYMKDDLDIALQTAKLALDGSKGKSASIQDTVGWILALQGKYDEALGYLREASVLDANNPEINYHLGYTLHKLGRRDDATRQLKIATMQENYSGYNDALQLLKSIQ